VGGTLPRAATLSLAAITSILAWPGACGATDGNWVWWEGEAPTETNFPKRTWFSPSPKEAGLLSAGAWLSNARKRAVGAPEAYARYRLTVPAGGEYNFWCRKMWKHGPFRWRFDNGKWQTCGRDVALADTVTIRTHVPANWVKLGKVKLAKGVRTFELRLLAGEGESLTAAFDAFLLTPTVFFPSGKLKPGEKSGKAEPGWFAWEPAPDPFTGNALLDLRRLNEKIAGQSGPVARRGGKFVLGSGKPVRFWAVNISARNTSQDRESIDYMARKLAKLGVNMVRYHSPLFTDRRDPARVDPKRLDNLQYTIAALKKQGIYTTLSFYFPLWFDAKAAGLEGFEASENTRPFALLFFDPKMQSIWRRWARGMLTSPNPHAPTPLAKDSAVAIVEIVNEDSLFFWTFSHKNVPGVYWRRLEKLYGDWLTRKHGSLAKARKAWNGHKDKRDDLAAGRMGLYEAWHMTRGGLTRSGDRKKKRMCDQVRFLAEVQRGFYEKQTQFIKQVLGYGGLVSCSNWQTADADVLDAVERWTYTAGDVIDRHGYFGGKHTGPGASYSVRTGHKYVDRPAVTNLLDLPIQVNQVADYPHTISEINWPQPNRYRADLTFLAAAYAGLQDVDGLYFFALGSNYVRDASINKFQIAGPAVCGTFPAAAMVYRLGYVDAAKPALVARLRLEDLFALKGERVAAAAALDELRKADKPAPSPPSPPRNMRRIRVELSPEQRRLAFYVGPVVRDFSPGGGDENIGGSSFDTKARTVRSNNGQLSWNYGKGVVTLNTPRAVGAAGFLGDAGPISLGPITIRCRNEYASIMVVSLDDQPLARSSKILIQTMTEEKPFGYRAPGGVIRSLGSGPFNVKDVDASLAVRLSGTTRRPISLQDLDENGYPTPLPQPVKASSVKLSPKAIYHVLLR